jgi:hypothetical protein
MTGLQHVPVEAMAPERFASVVSPREYDALLDLVAHATRELYGRVIWNVNSTARAVEWLRCCGRCWATAAALAWTRVGW